MAFEDGGYEMIPRLRAFFSFFFCFCYLQLEEINEPSYHNPIYPCVYFEPGTSLSMFNFTWFMTFVNTYMSEILASHLICRRVLAASHLALR